MLLLLDACLLQLNNLHHKVPDLIKRMNEYPASNKRQQASVK
jgi:hypothetical protein